MYTEHPSPMKTLQIFCNEAIQCKLREGPLLKSESMNNVKMMEIFVEEKEYSVLQDNMWLPLYLLQQK